MVLVFWSMLRNQVILRRTTGLEVAIRTVPGPMKPAIPPKIRPGAAPAPSPMLPMAAPRRKIGRIIEKKFKFHIRNCPMSNKNKQSGKVVKKSAIERPGLTAD